MVSNQVAHPRPGVSISAGGVQSPPKEIGSAEPREAELFRGVFDGRTSWFRYFVWVTTPAGIGPAVELHTRGLYDLLMDPEEMTTWPIRPIPSTTKIAVGHDQKLKR